MEISARDIINRLNRMVGDRSTLDDHLQEVADVVMPRKAQITSTRSPGEKYRVDTYDSTAILANTNLAAGMYSFLTPTNKRWFELSPRQKSLQNNSSVMQYFAEVNDIIYEEIASSNFALQMNESYLDLGWAGIAGLMLEESTGDSPSCLSYRNMHYSTYYIAESNQGVVDTLYRRFKLTARQAVQEFGDDVGEKILEAAKDIKTQDKEYKFIHAIFPRTDRDKTKKDAENMPWASIYVSEEDKTIIREGGYEEQPFMTPRFAKDNFEIYGRSPGMSVLPEINMVNRMKKTIIAAGQKVVDPPWLVPDNNSIARIRTTPGSLIYYNPSMPENKPQPLATHADVGLGMDLLTLEQDVIKKAFHEDLFVMLNNIDRQMTATEVLARLEEKVTIFAPTFGRLQGELFDVMLSRAFAICQRAGKLPDPPQELLENPNYEIAYISKLALIMRALDMKTTFDYLEYMAPIAQVDPSVYDYVDFDQVATVGARRFGLPAEFQRAKDEVDEIRQTRAAAAQQREQMAMAAEMAKTVPSLQGKTDPDSPMAQIGSLGGLPGVTG